MATGCQPRPLSLVVRRLAISACSLASRGSLPGAQGGAPAWSSGPPVSAGMRLSFAVIVVLITWAFTSSRCGSARRRSADGPNGIKTVCRPSRLGRRLGGHAPAHRPLGRDQHHLAVALRVEAEVEEHPPQPLYLGDQLADVLALGVVV